MPTQVQFRRGTTAQNNAFTGAVGEISVDTDLKVLRVHDGTTAGGTSLVSASSAQTLTNKTMSTVILSGNTTVTGNLVPSANLTYNLGNSTSWFGTFYGVSSQAKYADLAENYVADLVYDPGTVVVFGGEQEITTTTISHDSSVAGVISSNPAYLMNSGLDNGLPVALTGRVPCKVKGPVSKGDVLVTSEVPGVAHKLDRLLFVPGCIIGKSLEAVETDEIKVIEVVVGRF